MMKYEHHIYKDFCINLTYTKYSMKIEIEIPIDDWDEQLTLKFDINDLYSDKYDNVDNYQSEKYIVFSMAQRHMYERKIVDIRKKIVELLGL